MIDNVFEIEECETDGCSPFGSWFDNLHATTAAKVAIAPMRLQTGNHSNVKFVGSGVAEYRINFGPGYRIYFGKDGNRLIILLCGGNKKTQRKDIEKAKQYWQDCTDRKKQEGWYGAYKKV
jgi:putative addiction module killer protein